MATKKTPAKATTGASAKKTAFLEMLKKKKKK